MDWCYGSYKYARKICVPSQLSWAINRLNEQRKPKSEQKHSHIVHNTTDLQAKQVYYKCNTMILTELKGSICMISSFKTGAITDP